MDTIARSILDSLRHAGFTAYYAGGWVRDLLLGLPCDDIDIATNATPEQISQVFERTIQVGAAFGSVVVVKEGHSFEVTTFRSDAAYDGRRPGKVRYTSEQEDAQRRGLTINGLFYDPYTDTILDYVRGQHDLQRGIIRAIGDPNCRFEEDRLRMIRAVRFATRFGFRMTRSIKRAIRRHRTTLFPSVAIERVWQEFTKSAKHPSFARFLLKLFSLGLLPVIFPELSRVSKRSLRKRLRSLATFPLNAPPITRLMECFTSLPHPLHVAICRRLKVSNQELEWVTYLDQLDKLLGDPQTESIEWVKVYAHPHVNLALQIRAARLKKRQRQAFLTYHTRRQQYWLLHIDRYRANRPLVRAEHLIAQGVAPGPNMGRLLKLAETIAVRENLHNTQDVLDKLTALDPTGLSKSPV